jgi:hypothetical protein
MPMPMLMHMWWLYNGQELVRPWLGMPLVAYRWVTGSDSSAPTAALDIPLDHQPLHLVADTEAKALACRLCGIGMWLGRRSDIGHGQILAQLMDHILTFK